MVEKPASDFLFAAILSSRFCIVIPLLLFNGLRVTDPSTAL